MPTKLNNTEAKDTLRVLGPTALDVVGRLAADHPEVATCALTVVPAVLAFVPAYDTVQAHLSARREVLERRNERIEDVHRHMRSWLPLIRRDVPGLEGTFTADPKQPAEVIREAEELIETLKTHADGARLSYAPQVIERLTAAIAAARDAINEAQAMRVLVQGLQAKAREAAIHLQSELVALRGVLRATVGTHHLDYQQLRAKRIEQVGEEVDASSPDDDDSDDDQSLPAPVNGSAGAPLVTKPAV
jgi:hypothetical protein